MLWHNHDHNQCHNYHNLDRSAPHISRGLSNEVEIVDLELVVVDM